MTVPTPAQVELIRRFEPVLFFSPDENFFPSDAKRYVEHCALWKTTAPSNMHLTWSLAIETNKIAVAQNEAAQGLVYIGRKTSGGSLEFLQETTSVAETFLEMGGWKPAGTPGNKDIANLAEIARRYKEEPDLAGSKFWYHAEFFDQARLRGLFARVLQSGGHDFMSLLAERTGRTTDLNDIALICYYLLFPGHEEGLSGCQGFSQADDFASFAGDWACIAVLLDRPAENAPYTPKFVGLTDRNIGVVLTGGSEVRIGMRILPWNQVPHPRDDNPHFAVAKGSHALYLPGLAAHVVKPFTPDDPSRNSCGLAEPAVNLPPLTPAIGGVVGGIELLDDRFHETDHIGCHHSFLVNPHFAGTC